MEENFREPNSNGSDIEELRVALVKECGSQARSCLYTSTSFYIWLRFLRLVRGGIWTIAVIASTIAASSVVGEISISPTLIAALALAGVILPGILKALKIDETIDDFSKRAAQFKTAESHLRRASEVWSHKEIGEFENEARDAMKILDSAQDGALTPPEWCFTRAQRKIKSGDYDPDE